jgi:hypothetical protein
VQSGNGRQRVGFASIAFVLGGSVLLLASQPQSSAAQTPTKCQQFWRTDRDTGPNGQAVGLDASGVNINIYRNRNYAAITLSSGAMIGGLENTSATGNSQAYPQLGKHGKGCIFFQLLNSSTNASAAWMHPYGSRTNSQLRYALYCPNHPSMGKPIWTTVPTDCPMLVLTVRKATVTLRPPQGQTVFATQADALAALRLVLRKKFGAIPGAVIFHVIAVDGAWYPCDSNGCCRAA